MIVARSARLTLRELTLDDAAFVHELVNDPDWLRHIGDRGVHCLTDAEDYIRNGPQAMYTRLGHGLYAVCLNRGGSPIGMAGLIRRDTLPEVDLGYALLPAYRGKGYAREAAQACLDLARERFNLRRLLAIVSPANGASIALLEALGFTFERDLQLVPGAEILVLYACDLDTPRVLRRSSVA